MVPDLFALTQDSDGRTERVRRVVVSIFLVVILLQPAARLFIGPRSGLEWFQLAGALTLTGIVLWQLTSARDSRLRTQQWLGLALALAIALFVAGGPSWLATGGLPLAVDAALAWTVREGTTNVARHSRATHVAILISAGPGTAAAEISDNGPAWPGDGAQHAHAGSRAPVAGPAAITRARPALAGSGLAGLAERVRALGGELAAGALDGFLLRVVVPLPPEA